MDEDPGRQKREIEVKNLSAFSYDEDDLQFLRYSREIRHQQRSEDSLDINVPVSVDNAKVPKGWSELDFILDPSHLNSTGVYDYHLGAIPAGRSQIPGIQQNAGAVENICFDSERERKTVPQD